MNFELKIVITGAAGQLGHALVHTLGREWQTIGLTRDDLDVTNGSQVAATLATIAPGVIVNCAAFNDVDGAEDEPERAFRTNALAVANLARAAEAARAQLVHYSSDFVFDGNTDRPYDEDAAPRPGGTYAASKLVGEWLAAGVRDHYVLRVESLFGGLYKRGSSVDRIVEGLEAGRSTPVFMDRIVSPSYVFDVAAATAHLLRSSAPSGLYHCVNSGACTWLELGQEIARQLNVEPTLQSIRMSELPLRVPRPRYSALSNEKLRRAGMDMPTWQSALQRYFAMRQTEGHTRDKHTS